MRMCYGSRLALYLVTYIYHLRRVISYLLKMPASVACDREYELHKMDCLLLSCWKRWALESQRTKGTAEEQMRLILKSEIAIY